MNIYYELGKSLTATRTLQWVSAQGQISRKMFQWKQIPGNCRGYSTSWKRRIKKQSDLEDIVHQYVGMNAQRSDRVYVWGYAATGALGAKRFLKPEKNQRPRQICLAPHRLDFMDVNKIKAFESSCGYGFTVFLCDTHKGQRVYGTGINTDSQLGYQEYPRNSGRILGYLAEPAVIELPLMQHDTTKLVGVACGRAHTLINTDKEGVFSLGNNAYGQCGRPIVDRETYSGSQVINKVQIAEKVSQVECGQDHSLLVTEEGHVFSCGLGGDGQTGLGHYELTDIPQHIRGDIEGERIVSVSSKSDCVLAVSDKGEVFGWGNSEYNQLSLVSGDKTQVNIPRHLPFTGVGKVRRVAAAGSMCALLNDKGQVYVWGFGILGKGPKLGKSSIPEMIPETLFGKSDFNPEGKVVDISCGMNHFAAVSGTGDLYTWGHNKTASLGLGHSLDQFFPFKAHIPAEIRKVACGVDHMVVLCKAFA